MMSSTERLHCTASLLWETRSPQGADARGSISVAALSNCWGSLVLLLLRGRLLPPHATLCCWRVGFLRQRTRGPAHAGLALCMAGYSRTQQIWAGAKREKLAAKEVAATVASQRRLWRAGRSGCDARTTRPCIYARRKGCPRWASTTAPAAPAARAAAGRAAEGCAWLRLILPARVA